MSKIKVSDVEITIIKTNNEDYISLTDMIKAKDGDFFITDWLRNRNTLEFLSVWEQLYNPNFNYGEFAIIRNQSGLNSFKVSVKEWIERTGAIGVTAKAGRYGGTYDNLESHNADLIRQGLPPKERVIKLREIAILQLKTLRSINYNFSIQSPHDTTDNSALQIS